jgi:anti-sigma-K factor RskA
MTEHAVHLLSGAYAVGALDDLERARFEAHLETCADCRAEVAGLLEATALLAETSATPPPAHVREAVLAGIATVRPLPPVVPTETTRATASGASPRRWTTRFHPGMLAAAAAVIAAIGIGVVVAEPWDDEGTSQNLTAADRVLEAPDAQTVATKVGDATATVVVSRSQGKAVLLTEDMPAAPDGKVYELWLQTPEDDMVPAGLMPPGANQTVLLEGDASDAVGVGITIEPEGGSKEPSLPPVALIELA